MATQRICSIEGCGKPHGGRGLCKIHWQQHYRAGTLATLPQKPSWEFLQAALKSETDECILWPYSKSGCGYGTFRKGGRNWLAHRLSCESRSGPAPADKPFACHSCGVRGCINPRHLRWGSPADNARDTVDHGNSMRGTRNANAKITPEVAKEIFLSTESQVALARRYGIARYAVQLVQSGKMWAHVTASLERPPKRRKKGANRHIV